MAAPRLFIPLALVSLLVGSNHGARAQSAQVLADARAAMVEQAIVGAGIKDPRVIDAIRNTPRHEFMPRNQRKLAYYDMAVSIGEGQTISPPYVVAYMTEQLEPQPTDKVLEIGTGSGYQAAVLSPLVAEVYTIEIVESLGRRATTTLRNLDYDNVHVRVGDGFKGWAEHAPFDKIIVTCSPEKVPRPLVDQLREGGRMIIPLGERYHQSLYLLTKRDGELVSEPLQATLFVPMTGEAERLRQVLPDGSKPGVYNGSFEELAGEPPSAVGWHYQRYCQQVEASDAPEGGHIMRFDNDVPGRSAQMLQGFACDGRKVKVLVLSAWVKATGVVPGPSVHDLPTLAVTFYNDQRAPTATKSLGPWRGSSGWEYYTVKVAVPADARDAIVRIGLLGATGRVEFDGVEIKPDTP